MKRRADRGQTLVLFALTMLLLVVMVCLTLAIGMKTREKIELQTLADSVAYSNAVATARTYNTIAVWTRAQVSHMVVLAGAQSHISYASWYLATVKAASNNAYAEILPCGAAAFFVSCFAPACAGLAQAGNNLNREYNRAYQNFQRLDRLAGAEAKMIQTRAWLYGQAGKLLYADHWRKLTTDTGLGDDLLKVAVPDDERRAEYRFRASGNAITALEVGPSTSVRPGAWQTNSNPYPALPATLGSRESAFIRTRKDGIAIAGLNAKLAMAMGSVGLLFANPDGTAHFGTAQHTPSAYNPPAAWADDEGSFFGIITRGCGWFIPPFPSSPSARLKSTDDKDFSDFHRWSPGSNAHSQPENKVHDMGDCGDECPSVWVSRPEFNINPDNVNDNNAPRDQWRQPKHFVMLERDYTRRQIQDPWNLLFRFRFDPSGPGQEVDIGKQNATGSAFQRQAALATGITYYHRHMENAGLYWQEPPNFFNPFWRATLVPPDIDATGFADINAALAGSSTDFSLGYSGLVGVGFRGIQ